MRAGCPISFANAADWPHRWRTANVVMGPPASDAAAAGPWLYALTNISPNDELFIVYGYGEKVGGWDEGAGHDDRCVPPLRPVVDTNPVSPAHARSLGLPTDPAWSERPDDAARRALNHLIRGDCARQEFLRRAAAQRCTPAELAKRDRDDRDGADGDAKRTRRSGPESQ